jgi:hypothetical protein
VEIPKDLKLCNKCKEFLPLTEFSFYTGGNHYNTWCKACSATAARLRERVKAGTVNTKRSVLERARRAKLGAEVLKYLKTHPCVDCGETDPVVLDFDHVRGVKRQSVTRMISCQWSLTSVFEEIAKCVVRCANCHRRKTAKAQNWSRLRDYDPSKS